MFFAGTSFDGNRFPDQHIAERLTRYAPVLYVDPPATFISRHGGWHVDPSSLRPRLRLVRDRLARFTPVVVPPKTRGPMKTLSAALVRREAARAVRALTTDVAVAVAATTAPVLGICGEQRSVFYATDDFGAGASLMGLPESWAREREAAMVAAADIVIVVSRSLQETLRRRYRVESVLIENGVDDALFAESDTAPLPRDVHLDEPIAGFIGHLSNRIDVRMLEATAASGVSLLLVGPKQDTFDLARIAHVLELPNVQWVGPKAFEELPSYMRLLKVGLLPYVDDEFNRGSFPLKVLEYMAAGRPVVSTDLPAVRTLEGAVEVASSPAEYADRVRELLSAPQDPSARAERMRIAAERSWDTAAARFAATIGVSD